MQTVNDPTVQQYPKSFFEGLSQELIEEANQALQAWGLPDEIRQAIDMALYLEILAGYDPATFPPDGPKGLECESACAIKSAAWLLESVARLRADKVRSLTPEEYSKARRAK